VEGASAFVNPLTALCIIDAMKRDGHTALVHTAAASNLGQMLLRLCLQDGISLINVVRTQAQEELLRGMGGPTCSTPVRLPLPRISPDV
jgi:NADPH:quinone reductase-like Zn-dependent oxidoreductase